jgi:hypothetical protein
MTANVWNGKRGTSLPNQTTLVSTGLFCSSSAKADHLGDLGCLGRGCGDLGLLLRCQQNSRREELDFAVFDDVV